LVVAIVPAENASGTVDRFSPWPTTSDGRPHQDRRCASPTTTLAVIEGQKAGSIHIGYYGPGSYVRAHQVSGGNTVAFATTETITGAVGYYSVAYVKPTAPTSRSRT
jgi:phosphonate transport system substrate-binding protein